MKISAKTMVSLSMLAALSVAVTGCGTASSNQANGSNATSSKSTNTTGASASSKTVNIAWLPWTEDVAVTHLWKVLLQEHNYKVNLKELDVGPLLLGLSKNSVNVFFDLWLPTENNNVGKYKGQLTYLSQWYQGKTSQGVAVPQYMKNINTPKELNAHASEFKNRIVGIDPGSQEEQQVKKMVKTYGMNNIHVQDSSTPAMLTALKKAVDAKKPIAVVMWTPHWAFTKYHLKYISDPKYIVRSKNGNRILVAANKKWASSNPKISGWFKNFKLTSKQLATLEEAMKNSSNKSAAAKTWIKSHQSLVNGWFK